jgi:hypothetical protein
MAVIKHGRRKTPPQAWLHTEYQSGVVEREEPESAVQKGVENSETFQTVA